MVSKAIWTHNEHNKSPKISEILIHTGQHYDYEMSQAFFDQLKMPKPQYCLNVGSGLHGKMTGRILAKAEKVLMDECPEWVLVYGDTNTTIAGALAAAKLLFPVAHVEAGLRSFNMRMPEEINRVLTDCISKILFCPTNRAVENLEREGIVQGVHNVGDVMYDAYLIFKNIALEKSDILTELELNPGKFCLATVHRQENTNDPARLKSIFVAFSELANEEHPIIIPLHPRTQKALKQNKMNIKTNPHVRIISPVNYLDMLALEFNARIIMTDSGGIQKEAFFARIPCVTLRDETEWIETVETGWNHLAEAGYKKIIKGA